MIEKLVHGSTKDLDQHAREVGIALTDAEKNAALSDNAATVPDGAGASAVSAPLASSGDSTLILAAAAAVTTAVLPWAPSIFVGYEMVKGLQQGKKKSHIVTTAPVPPVGSAAASRYVGGAPIVSTRDQRSKSVSMVAGTGLNSKYATFTTRRPGANDLYSRIATTVMSVRGSSLMGLSNYKPKIKADKKSASGALVLAPYLLMTEKIITFSKKQKLYADSADTARLREDLRQGKDQAETYVMGKTPSFS